LDQLKLHIDGHVLIRDIETGEVILNRRNAIHNENMSVAIANSLSHATGLISTLALGNGGVVVDGNGNIVYNSVNVTDVTDSLHNQTYAKDVSKSKSDDSDNNTTVAHTDGTAYSDVVVTCTLEYGEPTGQDPLDDTADQEGDFVFDEIGLISQQGRLLTHLIFHPVQKSANRKIQVVYTLRITAG
jgi:hypothetical protein